MIILDDSIYIKEKITPPFFGSIEDCQVLHITAFKNGEQYYMIQRFAPDYKITINDMDSLRRQLLEKIKRMEAQSEAKS